MPHPAMEPIRCPMRSRDVHWFASTRFLSHQHNWPTTTPISRPVFVFTSTMRQVCVDLTGSPWRFWKFSLLVF